MARSHCNRFAAILNALLAALLLACIGCDSGPKVYPAKGTVVNKGKGSIKDIAGYNVQLQSVADPTEMPGGSIEADGSFVLYTYTRIGGKVVPGVKAGTYKACLQQPPVEGGLPPPLVIPKRYTAFETANIEINIKPEPNEITIDVDRNAR